MSIAKSLSNNMVTVSPKQTPRETLLMIAVATESTPKHLEEPIMDGSIRMCTPKRSIGDKKNLDDIIKDNTRLLNLPETTKSIDKSSKMKFNLPKISPRVRISPEQLKNINKSRERRNVSKTMTNHLLSKALDKVKRINFNDLEYGLTN